jgi:hypothetical protein
MRRAGWVLAIAGMAAQAGCSSADSAPTPRIRTEGWSSLRLVNTSRADAYDACLYAMKQWFKVNYASPLDGEVRSATVEYEQRGGTDRLRDAAIKYKYQMRRTATLIVQDDGGEAVVRCAVQVQRLDTADYRAFSDQNRYVDYPNETPIDTGAGETLSQNQVWTDMPRDRQLEQDILSVVRSRAEGARPATSSKAS